MYMCCIICSFEIFTSFNSSDLCIDENDVRVLKKSLTSEIWGLFSWLKYLKVQTNQVWTFWKKVKFAYKSVVVSTYSAMHKDTSGKNTNWFEIECIFFNSIKSTDCWWNDQQRNCIYLTFCKDISTKLDALLCMHYLKLMHAGLWYTLIVHFCMRV